MDEPPLDADEWSTEQWQAWLNDPAHEAVDAPPASPRPRSRGSAMLAAGMLGLERALYGKVSKPEIDAEAAADGEDDGLVVLDLDDPSSSTVTIRPPAD